MMSPSKYALPAGSLVLVSGANGYIASHIVDILLQLGFNVRGTIRTAKPWLDSFFQTKYGKPRYESVVVPAIEHDGSFDEAVKGVAGFIHVASDMSMDPDPDVVIPRTVKGTINALEASLKQSQVKRFVLTSSSTAAYVGQPNVEGVIIDEKSWNLTSLNIAMNKDTPIQMKGPHTYSASKTQQERTAWKWVEDNKPHFVFNAVLPNVNIGPILTPEIPGSVMGLVKNILNGDVTAMNMIRPQYFIDVRDTARLHVAALLDLDLQSTRIFAYAHALNWTDIISVMRKLKPDNDKIPQPPENEGRDLTEVMPRKRSEEILTAFFDRPGWTPLEETLSEAL